MEIRSEAPNLRLIRGAGAMAVVAGLANAVADFALRGGPRPMAGPEITLEMLRTVPPDTLWFGSVLGAAAMPLWILGLFPVYVGLRPAGRGLALLPVMLFGYGIAVASGYHGAYALYGSGQVLRAALPDVADATRHFEHLMDHHDTIQTIFVAPWVVASLSFVALVVSGRTGLPRWMAATSPILVPILVPLAASLPTPWGGYVRPALGSLLWTLFFAMALWQTWNGPPVANVSGVPTRR